MQLCGCKYITSQCGHLKRIIVRTVRAAHSRPDSYRSRLAAWFHSIYDSRARARGLLSGIAARDPIYLSSLTPVNLSTARESPPNWFNARRINSPSVLFISRDAPLPPRPATSAINNRRLRVASGIRCVSGRLPIRRIPGISCRKTERAVTLTNDTSGTASWYGRKGEGAKRCLGRFTRRVNKMPAIVNPRADKKPEKLEINRSPTDWERGSIRESWVNFISHDKLHQAKKKKRNRRIIVNAPDAVMHWCNDVYDYTT